MKRKMTAKQRRYFGKRKVVKVARRRRGRAFVGRSYRRASRGGLGGSMKGTMGQVFDGAAIGAIQAIIPDDALFGLADPAVMIGWGWFRKNQTAQFLGGYQLGQKILSGGFLGIGGGKTGGSGGMY